MQKKPTVTRKVAPGDQKQLAANRSRVARPGARPDRTIPHSRGDDRGNRLAWYVGGGLVALVVLLLAIGYYNDNIGPARGTAIRVAGHDVSLGYYRDRVKAAAVDAGDSTLKGVADRESGLTDAIEEEQTYLLGASSLGVMADESDVQASLAKLVHAEVQDGKLVDPASYLTLVRSTLQRDGLSLGQIRENARALALKTSVLAKFKAGVPKQALAVRLGELIFSSEAQGRAAQARLEQGDAFTDIAADSVADKSIGRAQPIDWTPVPFGILPGAVDDAANKLNVGDVSDLIRVNPPTPAGSPQWYLITVQDRDPQREVTDVQATQIATRKQADWLAAEKLRLNVRSLLDDFKLNWAVTHSGLPAKAPATPTPSGRPNVPSGVIPGVQPGSSGPAVPQSPGQAPAGPPQPPSTGPQPASPGQNPVPPVPSGP